MTQTVSAPKVFLDYDQAALDAAYDQAVYASNRAQLLARYASASEITRRRLGPPRRVAYGSAPIEGIDLYLTDRPDAPINVFIHGGAWRNGTAHEYAFPAEPFVRAGAHFAAVDFNWVQDCGGSLMPMADQVRRAIAWVARNAASFGGDASRIHLTTHSSGAHLGGCALITDWGQDFGLPANVVKGAVLASGMYELYPVSLSARSSYVKFNDEMLQSLSAIRHIDRLHTPIVVAYGSLETPEFQRQPREFVAAVQKAGKQVELICGENYNHFEIAETYSNPYGVLGRAALAQMKLA